MSMKTIAILLLLAVTATAQDWKPLLNGKNLDGWEIRGNSQWTLMKDGTLVGERIQKDRANPFYHPWPVDQKHYQAWLNRQSWIYTVASYGEFDLHVEYWIPPGGNSGVSIRDTSRAKYAISDEQAPAGEPSGTPAHIGYEIQIIDPDNNSYSSGSVYLFAQAKRGVHKTADWNSLDIESRNDEIRVKLNGQLVARSAGDPSRPKVGPIGLQLHDQFTFAMFRNVRIRDLSKH